MKKEKIDSRNAVIYARYSSHNQTEQSIEGQLRVCHEYAQREGYIIIGEYIDRAISGKTDDRPDFQRMISDSRKKAFQFVIVYKLDRFARNRYDSAIYKYRLKQNGVKLLSAMENIGDNPEGIILEAVLEASAEYYSLELAQKIKRGLKENALKGKFCGAAAPIGYKCVDGNLILDEVKAPYIKKAFEQYAAGVSKKQIVAELNAVGLRNRNGNLFSNTALQTAFQNKKYIGILGWNGIAVENTCPALIDEETFNKVQERIMINKKLAGKRKAKIEYLLTGKIFCGYCGATIAGTSGYGGSSSMICYYSCRNRRINKSCKKAYEKKDFLEWYVVEQTVNYVLTPGRMELIAKSVATEYENEFNDTKIKQLERQVAKLEQDINKYTESLLELPKSSWASIGQKIETATLQKTDIEIDLAKLRVANKIRYTEKEIVAWLKLFCKGDLFDMKFRQRIIDTFINSIFLYDDRIVIFYNIRGGKQISYIDMLDATKEASNCDISDAEKGIESVRILKDSPEHGREKDTAAWLSREYGGPEHTNLFIVRAGSP
ncbi:MAG: recombinase family protein, partial [Oscillospiraceae bacterium]|nr:recombinase family protein [Oscillospiraceae bacterium]